MVILNRIYTKTGDKGTTRLVGGQEVPKDDLRIDAYGTVDELNAVMGLVRAELLACTDPYPVPAEAIGPLDAWILLVQQNLFNLGSDLATLMADRWPGQPLITSGDIAAMEEFIDIQNDGLGVLRSFVLPGGTRLNALLHLARTVCRRAERRTITLARSEDLGPEVIPWLNRLSDALFVLSRRVSQLAGAPEVLWQK